MHFWMKKIPIKVESPALMAKIRSQVFRANELAFPVNTPAAGTVDENSFGAETESRKTFSAPVPATTNAGIRLA